MSCFCLSCYCWVVIDVSCYWWVVIAVSLLGGTSPWTWRSHPRFLRGCPRNYLANPTSQYRDPTRQCSEHLFYNFPKHLDGGWYLPLIMILCYFYLSVLTCDRRVFPQPLHKRGTLPHFWLNANILQMCVLFDGTMCSRCVFFLFFSGVLVLHYLLPFSASWPSFLLFFPVPFSFLLPTPWGFKAGV